MNPSSAMQRAKDVIQQGYENIQEPDTLISITERGLEEAIAAALLDFYKLGQEDTEKLVETLKSIASDSIPGCNGADHDRYCDCAENLAKDALALWKEWKK